MLVYDSGGANLVALPGARAELVDELKVYDRIAVREGEEAIHRMIDDAIAGAGAE